MGEIVLAAKIAHVPAMVRSEQPGPYQGCRQAAVDGVREIARRMRDGGVDTVVIFDTHWLVNSGYHLNARQHFSGTYTSHEFPHFIQNMTYQFDGAPPLSNLIAEKARAKGLNAMSHEVQTLTPEYGTLIPVKFMQSVADFKIVSVAAWCTRHQFQDSRRFGEAVVEAVSESDSRVGVLASGSLSHLLMEDGKSVEEALDHTSCEFNRQVDLRVVELWRSGQSRSFLDMLERYAEVCYGEGNMHDTAMLFGVLGWDQYQGKAEIVTDYFPSWGSGQINAVFPL